jgi:hypothetical protein
VPAQYHQTFAFDPQGMLIEFTKAENGIGGSDPFYWELVF